MTTDEQRLFEARWLARTVGLPGPFPLSSGDVDRLAERLEPVELAAGTTLIKQGEVPAGMWAVREGTIELIDRGSDRRHVVRLIREGETVGDVEILRGRPSRFTVRAEAQVRGLFISSHEFPDLLASSMTFAMRWISKLAEQVGRNQERITELLPASLTERVARLLLDHASDRRLQVSQTELARMLGAHRSPLNQSLKALERDGLIQIGYRSVEVLDREGLATRAALTDPS